MLTNMTYSSCLLGNMLFFFASRAQRAILVSEALVGLKERMTQAMIRNEVGGEEGGMFDEFDVNIPFFDCIATNGSIAL